MAVRVFVVHGWEGSPGEGWFPWLKRNLDAEVHVLAMPNPEEPEIDAWVSAISGAVGAPDEETFFVGHSIGCQAILRFLQALDNPRIGGLVLVAPWTSLKPVVFEEEGAEEVARPWLDTPIDWEKAKEAAKSIVAVFSKDDQYVPLEEVDVFREKLGAKVIVRESGGHMGGDDKVYELPAVLEELQAMIKSKPL